MKTDCDKIQDMIADYIADFLPEKDMKLVREHIRQCSSCSSYKDALQREDILLDDMFGKLQSDMSRQEDEVIKAVECCADAHRAGISALFHSYSQSRYAKLAAVAAVIVLLALNYIITFSWISEIKACIQLCS